MGFFGFFGFCDSLGKVVRIILECVLLWNEEHDLVFDFPKLTIAD